jgi:hypothetical protein
VGTWISAAIAAVVGIALAVLTALGITSSATKAPAHNPASSQVVDYGTR